MSAKPTLQFADDAGALLPPYPDVAAKVLSAKNGSGALLTILGSGPSTGVPRLTCLTRRRGEMGENSNGCSTCHDAARNPLHSRNHRGNPSAALRLPNGATIVIDCGKTFRQSVSKALSRCVGAPRATCETLEVFHRDFAHLEGNAHHFKNNDKKGESDSDAEERSAFDSGLAPSAQPLVESQLQPWVPAVDAVLLTHAHADAFMVRNSCVVHFVFAFVSFPCFFSLGPFPA
jgi:ribonuclease BN (tRNA processing enzyme)